MGNPALDPHSTTTGCPTGPDDVRRSDITFETPGSCRICSRSLGAKAVAKRPSSAARSSPEAAWVGRVAGYSSVLPSVRPSDLQFRFRDWIVALVKSSYKVLLLYNPYLFLSPPPSMILHSSLLPQGVNHRLVEVLSKKMRVVKTQVRSKNATRWLGHSCPNMILKRSLSC